MHARQDVAAVPAGQWAAPPLTVKLPRNAGYASITESALVGYGGLALRADGRRGYAARLGHEEPVSYPYRLRYKPDDIARLSSACGDHWHHHIALARGDDRPDAQRAGQR